MLLSQYFVQHLGMFTLLCPKGPGYAVKNNTVDGKENISEKFAERFAQISSLTGGSLRRCERM